MDNTTEMIYPENSKIQQAYDVAGRLTSFTNKGVAPPTQDATLPADNIKYVGGVCFFL